MLCEINKRKQKVSGKNKDKDKACFKLKFAVPSENSGHFFYYMGIVENFATKIFGKCSIASIEKLGLSFSHSYKVVVFCSVQDVDKITFAMASEGAGEIGNYSVCSFRIKGVGTFKGNQNSNPKIGKRGKFELAEEVRLEMICNGENLNRIINAMLEVHSYDEPAYEIYHVMIPSRKNITDVILVRLKTKTALKDILAKLNRNLLKPNLPSGIMIKNVYIDFSDSNLLPGINRNFKSGTTLIISKHKREYNFRII